MICAHLGIVFRLNLGASGCASPVRGRMKIARQELPGKLRERYLVRPGTAEITNADVV